MSTQLPGQPYQVIDPQGKLVGKEPDLPASRLLEFYRWMILGRTFSDRMVALQRQGRVGTVGALNGQEAASVAMGFALEPRDWLAASYREQITMMIKGVPMLAIMRLYQGQVADLYPAEARTLPLQIVVATQMLHATGLAMAARIQGEPVVAMGVCGDGGSSEGDFYEALNFAGVFQAPAVFCVQNNGWAISVPRQRQTASETIAHKALAAGLRGAVADGNDVLASFQVVKDAVDRARAGGGPSLIELQTYRLGAHTTADDPKRYVPPEEVAEWQRRDPIVRFRRFLFQRDLLSEVEAARVQEEVAVEVSAAVAELEAMQPTAPEHVFAIVQARPTPQLQTQREDLLRHLAADAGRGD